MLPPAGLRQALSTKSSSQVSLQGAGLGPGVRVGRPSQSRGSGASQTKPAIGGTEPAGEPLKDQEPIQKTCISHWAWPL